MSEQLIWLNTRDLIQQAFWRAVPSHLHQTKRKKTITVKYPYETILWLSLMNSKTSDGNGGYLHQPCIDRTYTIKPPFNFCDKFMVMPSLINSNKTFEEICRERCRSVIDNANEKIVLMWSGGVDSTCILSSMILEYGLKQAAEKIIIMCNRDSIEENPHFYHTIIKDNFEIVSSNHFNITLAGDNFNRRVLVNGDPAGALEGGSALRTLIINHGVDITSANWKDVIKKHHSDLFFVDIVEQVKIAPGKVKTAMQDYFIDCIEQSAAARNFAVDNVYDCFWWYLINFKWNSMCLSMLKNCKGYIEKNEGANFWNSHFIPFFGTDDFVIWSFNNRERMLSDRLTLPWPAYYKKSFKEIILKVDNNMEYFTYKGKEAKLQNAMNKDVQQMAGLTFNFKPLEVV